GPEVGKQVGQEFAVHAPSLALTPSWSGARSASPDDASHRRENHEAPLTCGHSSRHRATRLLRMRSENAERLSDFGGLELHGFAAAASRDLVRIVEDELGLHLVGLVVHLGAEQE